MVTWGSVGTICCPEFHLKLHWKKSKLSWPHEVVTLTAERKGYLREGFWEEKHLGHFIIWERSAPTISKQWRSEAKQSAQSKQPSQRPFVSSCVITQLYPTKFYSRVFCMSPVMTLMVLFFNLSLGGSLSSNLYHYQLSSTVLTLEYGAFNCQWTHPSGISEPKTGGMYTFCCISAIICMDMAVLGTLPWACSCYARIVICYQPPVSRAPQHHSSWVWLFALKCVSSPRDVIAL